MTGTFEAPRRTTRAERFFVLAGPAVAAFCTAALPALGNGPEFIGFAWIVAIAWTAFASFAAALWRGFRHRDWSAFRGYDLPDDREDEIDWSTRTRTYAWLGDMEEKHLHDDGHLR